MMNEAHQDSLSLSPIFINVSAVAFRKLAVLGTCRRVGLRPWPVIGTDLRCGCLHLCTVISILD
jgi:hypothetical protein